MLLVALFATAFAAGASGQSSDGGTASAAGGALLGLYSGAGMGLVGSLMPCNRTLAGSSCAATGAVLGGAFGLVMGGVIGAENHAAITERTEDAAVGAAIGAGIGVILKYAVRHYEWADAAALAAVGGAFGAASEGVAWGAAAGATAGLVSWLARSEAGVPDVFMFLLAGAAVGSFYDWANGASAAKQATTPQFSSNFSIPFR